MVFNQRSNLIRNWFQTCSNKNTPRESFIRLSLAVRCDTKRQPGTYFTVQGNIVRYRQVVNFSLSKRLQPSGVEGD